MVVDQFAKGESKVSAPRTPPSKRDPVESGKPKREVEGPGEARERGTHSCKDRAAQLQRELTEAHTEIARLIEQGNQLWEKLQDVARQVEEARLLAYHDELTALPNRRFFKENVRHALAQSSRNGTLVALVLIDLDGFKPINDTFGHAIGDELLRVVAERLKGSIRLTDTACRYGGDEFVVLFPDLDDRAAVERVTDKIRSCFDAPCVVGGHSVNVAASIGCAVYPDDADTLDVLLTRADQSMYRCKLGSARMRDTSD